ncbi:hypothetical protein [Haloplanus salilacus]|uniref:hypothetical protein n=1 Tax=Haloplanus salilacus TaxID=2949994 RepID=UPI0030CC8081
MATVLDIALMGVVLVGNTFLAAVMTRFFRIQLDTRWGAIVYTAFLVPVVLVVTTIGAFSLGVGVDLGSAAAALALMVGLPMGLGVTIDVLYVPAPDEYDLPDTAR